jgi:hypothetical protein
MTDVTQEWVVYKPPKSVSFGHQSTPRDPRKAWPQLQRFLAEVSALEVGHQLSLTCHSPNPRTEAAVAERRIEAARRLFGPEREPERDFPNIFPHWQLSDEQMATAVRFALDDDQFPKQDEGPVRFYFSYSFLWPEFEQFPYRIDQKDTRKRQSGIGVFIGGNRLFLQPHFVFPAPWHSPILQGFLRQLEKTLPFSFRDQYFKRWIPKLTKGAYNGRSLKLDKNWRNPLDLGSQ